ncbi:arginine--tRNA ligase [Deltaproteobacteria bacterium TL4]
MLSDIFTSIHLTLQQSYSEITQEDISIQLPPNQDLGDFAVPCFNFAKKLKKAPQQIAQILATLDYSDRWISRAEAVGPYLNLFLNRVNFSETLFETIQKDENYGSSGIGKNKKAMIEHTSINPNASPHVGRARNALIGDALTRLLRFLGYEVEVHYYVNDMGKQIALLVLACEGIDELKFENVLELYVQANQKAEEDPAFEQQAFQLLIQYENGDQPTIERFRRIIKICLGGQLSVLNQLGIQYDCFDYESNYLQSEESHKVVEVLNQKGALFIDENERQIVDLQKLGFKFEEGRYFVLRRANGSSMYGFRDITYTLHKLNQPVDINLTLLGEDHKLYYQQLGLILQTAGYTIPEVIHYSYIILKEGKMSTRKGTVILLDDFIKESITRAKQRAEDSERKESTEKTDKIAEIVGIGAVKFSILKVSPKSNVIFDWEEALSTQGDSATYLQYTYARINSILKKYNQTLTPFRKENLTVSENEWGPLFLLASFEEVITTTVQVKDPAHLANYVLKLARKFNTFYNACPVLQNEDENTTCFRVHLSASVMTVIAKSLYLLGIDVPEQM